MGEFAAAKFNSPYSESYYNSLAVVLQRGSRAVHALRPVIIDHMRDRDSFYGYLFDTRRAASRCYEA